MSFENAPRVVIFMTAPRAVDIPCLDNSLACLLTFGSATFAERVLDSCALAGFREVDIVLGEDSKCVQEALKDDARWGIKLNWHYVPVSATPYAILQRLALRDGQRLLLGHGHQWVSDRILFSLIKSCDVAMHIAKAVSWTGWLSMERSSVAFIDPTMNFAALSRLAAATRPERCLIARYSEFANPDSALSLLLTQNLPLYDMTGDAVPESWLRMSWGAMSPDAIVHPQAIMTGPILVGPGCLIARNARVGPGVVLSPHALIAQGAVVKGSLVLANTYVDSRSVLEHCLARGNTAQMCNRIGGQAANSDGMNSSMLMAQPVSAGVFWQLLAACLALTFLPSFLLLLLWNYFSFQPFLWQKMRAVCFCRLDAGPLYCSDLRQPHLSSARSVWLVGCYGALLDVMQGRRSWFGMRPRTQTQWSRLGRDWQKLFLQMAPGFFYTPAWGDNNAALDADAQVAANAYLAAQSSFERRLSIFNTSARKAFIRLNYLF